MKLSDYLDRAAVSDEAFAALVKRDRSQVTRWRRGKSIPDADSLQAIFAATGGKVSANDFFHSAAQTAVATEGAAA